MVVAIIGSRNMGDFGLENIITHIPKDATAIISGGAIGIDSLAEKAAQILSLSFVKYLPDYKKYGKFAPLKRNITIVQKADTVLAFWDFKSRGTAYTIAKCVEMQVPVRIFSLLQLE